MTQPESDAHVTPAAESAESGPTNVTAVAEDLVREYRRASGRGSRADGPTVRAVDGVTVRVRQGEMVGIAGPSGSGKSTLLHLLAGLDVPTSGTVHLAGTETSQSSERARATLRLEHVGIVFQRFHLLPALSARANVALPLVEQGIGKHERRKRAERRLKAVGLGDRVDHTPGRLSGGEQQRVAIARALVTGPDLVVADEPTGELDRKTGAEVLGALATVADGRAVVLASHDRQALDVCDRLLHLRDGQIVERD